MEKKTLPLWTVLLISFYWIQCGHWAQCGTEQEMRNLLNATLNNTAYSSRVRPIADTGNALQVKMDMYLVGINDVSEVEQKVTSTVYFTIEWPDTFITWTPADYGNIKKITIPQFRIWKPDIALSNAYDTITGLGSSFMYVTVDYNGTITWQPYQVFESSCTLDMTFFPFDEQSCDLLMVTWSSTKDMINLVTGTAGFNIDNYAKNANWGLISVSTYDSSTTSTSGLAFSMRIKRKPLFFLINFIVPIVLLSALNIFVFALPCDSGEKSGYSIVLFLSFAIFLLIVTDIMPEGMTTVPIISTYLLLECVISTLIVFLTIVQLRLHNLGDETDVPKFLRKFVIAVSALRGKLNCVKNADEKDQISADMRFEEKSPAIESTIKKSAKSNEAIGDKTSDVDMDSRRRDSKLRELIYGRKVSPQSLFSKPDIVSTPYDKDIELLDLDDDILNDNVVRKRSIPQPTVRIAPPVVVFSGKRRNSLISLPESVDSPSEANDNEADVTWADVSDTMDWFFFYLFAIITGLIVVIIFAVVAS